MAFKKPVKKPTRKELERGWRIYRQSRSLSSVKSEMGITARVWKFVKPLYSTFFAQMEDSQKKSTRKSEQGRPPGITMTVEQRRQLIELNSTGVLDIKKIASIMGVARRTIYNWMEKDEILKEEFETAKEKRLHGVVDAMMRSGTGMRLKAVNRYRVKDSNQKVISETETVSYREVQPSAAAARLILANMLGWSLDGGTGGGSDDDEVEFDIHKSLYEKGGEDGDGNAADQ